MELGFGLLLWATGSSRRLSLEWRSPSRAFCRFYIILQHQRVQARAIKQAGRHKRKPLVLEVSLRTSSSPNAGRVELNTEMTAPVVMFVLFMAPIMPCTNICCCAAWCSRALETHTCLSFPTHRGDAMWRRARAGGFRWSGALFLGHSAIFILFCSTSACKHALLNRPAGTKVNLCTAPRRSSW